MSKKGYIDAIPLLPMKAATPPARWMTPPPAKSLGAYFCLFPPKLRQFSTQILVLKVFCTIYHWKHFTWVHATYSYFHLVQSEVCCPWIPWLRASLLAPRPSGWGWGRWLRTWGCRRWCSRGSGTAQRWRQTRLWRTSQRTCTANELELHFSTFYTDL